MQGNWKHLGRSFNLTPCQIVTDCILSSVGRLDADDLENLRAVVGTVGKRSAVAQVGAGRRGKARDPRWPRLWEGSSDGTEVLGAI